MEQIIKKLGESIGKINENKTKLLRSKPPTRLKLLQIENTKEKLGEILEKINENKWKLSYSGIPRLPPDWDSSA